MSKHVAIHMAHLKRLATELIQETTDEDLVDLVIQLLLAQRGQKSSDACVLIRA